MSNQHDDGTSADERKQIVSDFKQAVNMTPAQLEKWLASEDYRRVGQKQGGGESVGHQSGRRIIDLLHKKLDQLSSDDIAHMRKVVGYIRRHSAQGPTKQAPEHSDWRFSLMNWGHDPLKH